MSWLLGVAHAPHSKRPEEEREAWWSRATRVIEGFRHAHELLTVCIDINARVGCNALPGVGPHGAEQANANTPLFESFLEALGLGLPCTLPVHEGPTTTWTSPKGSQSRIDFVAISLPFLSEVKFSCVDPHLDHLIASGDHQAVRVVVRLGCSPDSNKRAPTPRVEVPPESHLPWRRALAAAPLPSWSCSVDAHQGQFSKLVHGAARCCARRHPSRGFPRKPYVSQPILDGLALRKHLRGVLAQLECHVRRVTLAACFRGWKGGVGRCSELAAIRRSRAVHYRAYAVAAAHVRALLRAAKAAYLDELGCVFAGASLDKDVKTLFKALKGLVPALRSSPGFRLASLVKEGPGAPFADSAEAAVGWSKHFGAPEGSFG